MDLDYLPHHVDVAHAGRVHQRCHVRTPQQPVFFLSSVQSNVEKAPANDRVLTRTGGLLSGLRPLLALLLGWLRRLRRLDLWRW